VVSLRVTRDKRGYEYIYLVDESRTRGRVEGRLLYWSRHPGGLRVGREPLDEGTRAELERAHPNVRFDWPGLLNALSASAAQARWVARQLRQGAAAPPPPRGGRRSASRADDLGRGEARWDEADDRDVADTET
jgi:hypothetical protein